MVSYSQSEKGGNETAAEELPKDLAHSCCALHSWFILHVLMLHSNQIVAGLLSSGGTMDKQARKERMEKMITMEEALHTFEELPLPERFRKLAEWAETHLSAADQEWIYQQWQQVLERYLAEPPEEPAP